MKIRDLIETHNVKTNIDEDLKDHQIEFIVPPADQFEYESEPDYHYFTNTTGAITTNITIREKENNILVTQEGENGIKTPRYYEVGDNTPSVYF